MHIENLTIEYLKQKYASGETTPQDLAEYLINKSERYREKNIWIYPLSKEEISLYTSKLKFEEIKTKPLWGIPFVIKDNIDLAGIPTTAACEAFTYIPKDNATVVETSHSGWSNTSWQSQYGPICNRTSWYTLSRQVGSV